MVTNKKVYGKAMSMPAGIGIGVLISLMIVLIGCAIIAMLVDREIIGMDLVGYGAMATLLLASLFGAMVSLGLVKRRMLLVGMLQAVCFLCLLLLINGLMFGGAVDGIWPTALLLLGGSGCSVTLMSQGQEWKRSKAKRWRTG